MSYATTPSVRKRILPALRDLLLTVRTGNGFKTDILDARLGLSQRMKIKMWPAAIVVKGREVVTNKDMSDQALHKEWEITLLVFDNSANKDPQAVEEFQDDVLSDVERLIGQNFTLTETCFLARVLGSEPFNKLEGQNFAGIGIRLMIKYRQDEQDPNLAV